MSAVTARFQVSRITPYGVGENWTQAEVEMTPDYSDGANKAWAEATPAGVFRMTVKREVVDAHFGLGRKIEILIYDTPSA